MSSGIPVILPYKLWVIVLEAVDEARKDLIESTAGRKARGGVRATLQAAADMHSYIGEEISGQLECTARDEEPTLVCSNPECTSHEDIPDPRDGCDPTTPSPDGGRPSKKAH